MQHLLRKGTVDWTGDNPFIYLKQDPSGADWSSLSLYFRVATSRHGSGKVMVVIEQPCEAAAEGAARLCLTDNEPLARYLLEGFVKKFGVFRPCAGLIDRLDIVGGARFQTHTDGRLLHVESAQSADGKLHIAMTWERLGRAFAVDVPQADAQTGRHEMISIFQPAEAARVEVGKRRLAGQTVERDFFGGRAQSAALAHSETWILVEDAPA